MADDFKYRVIECRHGRWVQVIDEWFDSVEEAKMAAKSLSYETNKTYTIEKKKPETNA